MGTTPEESYTMSNVLVASVLVAGLAVAGWNWREDVTKLWQKKPATQTISKPKPIQSKSPDIEDSTDTGAPMSEVITTPSGLSYIVLTQPQEGAASPKAGQQVTVHYTGWLLENDESKPFDSSVRRGQPFKFIVGIGQVIKGWDEAVLSMKVGEKRQITLPPHLGYGARGAGGAIPGNATLVFNVELLAV